MEREEAVRLVVDHCAASGYNNYPADLEAWETPKGWVIGPRADLSDLNKIYIGSIMFLVTPDGLIYEGSGSLPPRIRWDHVPV